MSKIYLLIMVFFLTLSFSAKVNILNDDPNVDIYINGMLAGKGNVSGYELPKGEHFIKIYSGDMIIYAESIRIVDDSMKTINTSHFVDSKKTNIANVGPKKVEAKRVREARGDFAMGMHYSQGNSGISIKYFPLDRWGIQVAGWANSSPGNIHESYLIRPIYQMGDYLLLDRHMNTYLALGFGNRKIQSGAIDEDYEIIQGMAGVEGTAALMGFPLAIASIGLLIINNDGDENKMSAEEVMYIMGFFGGIFLSVIDNAYVNLEMGYERAQDKKSGDYTSGIKIGGGMHFYF